MSEVQHEAETIIKALEAENARLRAALLAITYQTPESEPSEYDYPGMVYAFTQALTGYKLGRIARQALAADQEGRE